MYEFRRLSSSLLKNYSRVEFGGKVQNHQDFLRRSLPEGEFDKWGLANLEKSKLSFPKCKHSTCYFYKRENFLRRLFQSPVHLMKMKLSCEVPSKDFVTEFSNSYAWDEVCNTAKNEFCSLVFPTEDYLDAANFTTHSISGMNNHFLTCLSIDWKQRYNWSNVQCCSSFPANCRIC